MGSNISQRLLDEEGLRFVIDELLTRIDSSSDVIQQYASIYEFPSTGKVRVLYIDTTNNRAYRWDDDETKYYCIGSDYSEIEIINGGTSE